MVVSLIVAHWKRKKKRMLIFRTQSGCAWYLSDGFHLLHNVISMHYDHHLRILQEKIHTYETEGHSQLISSQGMDCVFGVAVSPFRVQRAW